MAQTARTKPGDTERLSRKTGTGDAFRRCAKRYDRSLLRLAPRSGAMEVVTVHHFRTAIRRLRSLLASFKELLPAAERKVLSARLKNLSRRYAELRDWDVLVEAMTDNAGHSDRRKLAGVVEAAKLRRRAAAARHRALSEDIRAVDRAIRTTRWLHAPASGKARSWNRPIGEFAPELLDRQWRQMRKSSRKLDLSDATSLHKFRIATKKHRYTIECLLSLYDKKKAKAYLERLVAIQDVLGELRDALNARALIATLRLQPASRRVAEHWLERRGTQCAKRFPACDKAFRRETPFWED
jgi:CHAD domain-containing protein